MVSALEEEKKKRFTEKELLFLDKLTQPNPYTGEFYNPIQDSSSRQDNLGIIQGLLDNDKIPNKDFSRNLFSEVYIYGFDTYDPKYDNQHYFENKPNKYKNNTSKDHSPDKEKQYINYMIKNKKIKLLK